jgi:hypothetical protein
MKIQRFFLVILLALLTDTTAYAQRKIITPEAHFGLSLNVDANGLHAGRYKESRVESGPAFSFALAALMHIGEPSDLLNLSIGCGYRGLFDQTPPHEFVENPSYSDYSLYVKSHNWRDEGSEVRPLGGLIVFPFELHLNILPLGETSSLFIGSGVEYGLRLYQPNRYARYFGANVMNRACLSVSPEIGITFGDDDDDVQIDLSLYLRHYVYNCFNTKDLPIGKFSHNYLGLQAAITL